MKHHNSIPLVLVTIITLLLASCGPNPSSSIPPTPKLPQATPTSILIQPSATATAVPIPTATQVVSYQIWLSAAVPQRIQEAVSIQSRIQPAQTPGPLTLRLEPADPQAGEVSLETVEWIYALVAPFPTLTDGYTLDQFRSAWGGQSDALGCQLIMDASTHQALTSKFGASADGIVRELPAENLLEAAWQERNLCAVVPFEELQPRWKVLRIDGLSPLDRQFATENYPLAIKFSLNGPEASQSWFWGGQPSQGQARFLPVANRNADHLTVLVMTGVTALVRATAWKMDTQGILFPAESIGDVLRDADITHISNEIAFAPDCPLGDPNTASLRFCSRPEYLQLLESVGTDVIELTGNHMNDWGPENMLYTLNLYKEHHLKYFAGGANLEEAQKALLVEDHGNKLAFIGCNPAGPASDWATESMAGSAPCDLDWEAGEIARLKGEGYLPIATFQYLESYDHVPVPWQVRDFKKVSEAGAVIVSGSQAHYPQAFEFTGENLIHYGLGNLFFDQMNPLINGIFIPGTRREFIDRHYFYEGKYLGTELITAMLEDYARPRLMTTEERQSLLGDIFTASGW